MLKVVRLDQYNVYVTDEYDPSHTVDVHNGTLFIAERSTPDAHTIYAPGTWLSAKYSVE